MTTLAKDQPRNFYEGNFDEIPMVAADIIYRGAAGGSVDASGHARPLVGGDKFRGFAESQADNSTGAAAAIDARLRKKGRIKLSVSGAVATDLGQPVYATDDDTFVFLPTGASFVGFVRQFVSSGVVIVEYDVDNYTDPYLAYGAPGEYTTVSDDLTLDIEDNGKVLFVDTDAKAITLPAVATGLSVTIVNIGAFGTVAVNVDPAAADMIHAPDIAGTDNKDHINTKATARRGDLVQLIGGLVATGYNVTNQVGTWAQEA